MFMGIFGAHLLHWPTEVSDLYGRQVLRYICPLAVYCAAGTAHREEVKEIGQEESS